MRDESSFSAAARSQKEAHPTTPVLRVFLLQDGRLEWAGLPAEQATTWSRSSGRALFFLLLCVPNRRACRSQLASILWPETDEERALDSLRSALKSVRAVLRSGHSEHLLEARGELLILQGQEHLWTDLDAIAELVQQARNASTPQEALPLWEQARVLLHGELLAEEHSREWSQCRWIKVRRQELRAARRAMIRALADFYTQSGQLARAEDLLHAHVIRFPTDQDALYRLMRLLLQTESFEEARTYYERCRAVLADLGKEPARHVQALAQECRSRPQKMLAVWKSEQEQPQVGQHQEVGLSFSPSMTQGILETTSIAEGNVMDQLRRQFIQQLLGATGITIVPSHEEVTVLALLEQLTTMLSKPSSIDEPTIRYLERQSTRYWQDWHENALSAYDLLSYVTGHLQKVMTFFHTSLLPSTRMRLCSVAGETALLMGTLLFEAGDYSQARRCFQTAIQAAHEANHPELEATGWGWVSFTHTYSGDLPTALHAIQTARQLLLKEHTSATYASLAAIEAEVQARVQNRSACFQALEQARCIEATNESHIWTSFDTLKLAGYKGICLQHLYQPGDTSTYSFLEQAQNTFIKALESLESSNMLSVIYSRQRAIFHTDIAGVYIRQGQIKDACQHASQSVSILRQTRSQTGVQRLLALRRDLKPWENTSEVQNVDRCIDSLHVTERH